MFYPNTSNRSMSKLALFLSSAFLSCAAFSQDLPDAVWHGGVAIGGSFATGSNSSRNVNANVNGKRASIDDKIHLHAIANYGSSTTDEVTKLTAQLFRAGGRYDYNLSEDVFVFIGAERETNKLQNIDTRSAVDGGAGYKILHSAESSWDLFAGAGYSSTKLTTQTRIFPPRPMTIRGSSLVIGEESSHKISQTSTIKQKFVVYPGQSEVGTRGVWDLSLNTVIVGGWTLNVGANIEYESKLGPEYKSISSLVTFGFGYKY
jgi:putative salt-induced outer membrane protein